MEKIVHEQLDEKLQSHRYVILDFSSPGCAPCKKVPGLLEEILAEMQRTDIATFEVDISTNRETAQKFFVLGVPTIIIFKDGKEIKRFNSLPKPEKIRKALE